MNTSLTMDNGLKMVAQFHTEGQPKVIRVDFIRGSRSSCSYDACIFRGDWNNFHWVPGQRPLHNIIQPLEIRKEKWRKSLKEKKIRLFLGKKFLSKLKQV